MAEQLSPLSRGIAFNLLLGNEPFSGLDTETTVGLLEPEDATTAMLALLSGGYVTCDDTGRHILTDIGRSVAVTEANERYQKLINTLVGEAKTFIGSRRSRKRSRFLPWEKLALIEEFLWQ